MVNCKLANFSVEFLWFIALLIDGAKGIFPEKMESRNFLRFFELLGDLGIYWKSREFRKSRKFKMETVKKSS